MTKYTPLPEGQRPALNDIIRDAESRRGGNNAKPMPVGDTGGTDGPAPGGRTPGTQPAHAQDELSR